MERPTPIAIPVFPFPGLNPAFNVNQLPFVQILAADLGQSGPGYDVVPLSASLAVTALVGPGVIRRDREIGDCTARTGLSHLGILSQTPN